MSIEKKYPRFESARQMVDFLMTNESMILRDDYGREWMYENYIFTFTDITGVKTPFLKCLHLFNTVYYLIGKAS